MAQALSNEEFRRMQAQLIELRTSNYQLVDQCKKLQKEVATCKATSETYEKDLQKANKTISKSKKARDVEALIAENDSLQRKLHSQEDDFRLQNSTLMEELSKLCTTNENLEKELDKVKQVGGSNKVKYEDGEQQGELRRLQAVNAALQKNVISTQEKYEEEIKSLKNNIHTLNQTISELEDRCVKLLGERPSTTGADGDGDTGTEGDSIGEQTPNDDPMETVDTIEHVEGEETVESQLNCLLNSEFDAFIEDLKLSAVTSDFDDDIEPKDPVTVLQGHAKQLKTRLSGVLVRNMESLVKLMSQDEDEPPLSSTYTDTSNQAESQENKIGIDVKKISEMQLQIDTEKEENRLLIEQLHNAEQSYKSELSTLKEEITKLTEKAKKKQESLLQLQNEKEQLYTDSRKQYEDLQTSKDVLLVELREEKVKLSEELTNTKQLLAIQQDQSLHKLEALEKTVSSLSSQTLSSEEVASLQADNSNLRNELDKVKKAYTAIHEELTGLKVTFASTQSQLEQAQGTCNKLTATKEDMMGQLEECLNANSQLGEQLQGVQNDRDNLHRDLRDANKLAENRKTMLDDMAIQTQTIKQNHTDEITRLKDTHSKETNELRQQLQDEQKRMKDLAPLEGKVAELEEQMQSIDNSRGWFERRLEETEQEKAEAELDYTKILSELKDQHKEQIQDLKEELAEKDLQFSQANERCDRHLDNIAKLRQDIKDGVEDRKLSEKKGLTMVKDLKRQLKQERKRADKLQDKISEVLSQHSQGKPGMDELFQHSLLDDRQKTDNSSVSSWSASGTREYASSDHGPSPDGSMTTFSTSLSEETTELIARLTELQQEKWSLEEKVRHLEESNSCMADDLLKKSAIIETHVMERKLIDPSKVSPVIDKKTALRNKIVEFVKNDDSVDSDRREMNQKLQVMLEETLTKNLHLQKDIEMLSEEVVRLSKLVPLSGSGTPTTDLPPHPAIMKRTPSTDAAMAAAIVAATTCDGAGGNSEQNTET